MNFSSVYLPHNSRGPSQSPETRPQDTRRLGAASELGKSALVKKILRGVQPVTFQGPGLPVTIADYDLKGIQWLHPKRKQMKAALSVTSGDEPGSLVKASSV